VPRRLVLGGEFGDEIDLVGMLGEFLGNGRHVIRGHRKDVRGGFQHGLIEHAALKVGEIDAALLQSMAVVCLLAGMPGAAATPALATW
jgi:hypothetical protein